MNGETAIEVVLPHEWPWYERVSLAKNYLAAGQAEQWLWKDDEEKPWSLVTRCEPSGGLLLSIGSVIAEVADSAKFRAEHPSGLIFLWAFALGDFPGGGRLNIERITTTLEQLSGEPREQFLALVRQRAQVLRDGAAKAMTEITETANHADQVLALT